MGRGPHGRTAEVAGRLTTWLSSAGRPGTGDKAWEITAAESMYLCMVASWEVQGSVVCLPPVVPRQPSSAQPCLFQYCVVLLCERCRYSIRTRQRTSGYARFALLLSSASSCSPTSTTATRSSRASPARARTTATTGRSVSRPSGEFIGTLPGILTPNFRAE